MTRESNDAQGWGPSRLWTKDLYGLDPEDGQDVLYRLVTGNERRSEARLMVARCVSMLAALLKK